MTILESIGRHYRIVQKRTLTHLQARGREGWSTLNTFKNPDQATQALEAATQVWFRSTGRHA